MKIDKKNVYKIILILVVFFVCIPAFRLCDHFKVNDLDFHIKRVDGLLQAIYNINFPYRINSVANSGYGGADPVMYPYLFLYVVAFLYKITNDFNISFNIFYIIVNVATAYIIYYATYELFKNKNVALWSTIMTMLSFYRMWEIYVGACVGQYLAIMFVPLVYEGYFNILKGKYNKWIDIFIGLCGICLSHSITGFYTGCLLMLLSVIFIKKIIKDRNIIISIMKVVILFLLINLWYIVPFFEYFLSDKIITPHIGFPWKQVSKLTFIDNIILTIKIILNNVCLNIFDESKIHMKVSYMGLFLIIFIFVFCIYKLALKSKAKDKRSYNIEETIVIIFLLIFAFNLIVSSGVLTRTFFGRIGVLQSFFAIQQFEHREIVRGEPLFYMACAYIIENYIKHKNIVKATVAVLGVISLIGLYTVIFSSSKVYDNCYDFVNSDYMLKGTVDGDIRDKIKLEYKYVLPKDIFDENLRIDNDGIKISNAKKGYLSYKFDYEISDDKEHKVDVPLFNYNGYIATEGKKRIKIKTGDNALISINVKKDKGSVNIKFEEKIEWLICDIISLLSIIGLIISKSILYVRHKNK